MNTPRLLKVVALSSALALAAAACGDDDDDAVASSGLDESTSEVADESAGDDGADDLRVTIESPADGDSATSPVTVQMSATGIEIAPAGEVVDGQGHFHLMVDVECVEPGETIPGDTDGFNHFGKAQTEAELDLEPGEHTICLQVGDGAHTALDATDQITVTVE